VEPFYGDFSMNGPSCLKFIEHFPKFASLLDDDDDDDDDNCKDSFVMLFQSLDVLVGYLFTTTPLRVEPLSISEWTFIHGPLSDECALESDTDFFQQQCHQHGDLFSFAFSDTPPPKHHFLVFHAPQFAGRFGCIGMFSEQGMERSHSAGKDLNRKLRPMSDQTMKMKRKMVEMTAKAAIERKRRKTEVAIHKRN
jgi:hypothetical protein